MNIDWAAFTPYSALIGGALIGLAAAMMIVGIGRVAGVSGVVGGLFTDDSKESWRWYFVLGLLAAPWLYQLFNVLPEINIETPSLMLIVAGLLVGIGTRYGSGCTSGHGVCGLSSLSMRSLVATLTFMAVGFITVYGVRHVVS
ncbi:MAG: YeeE/YedE family protein [Moraxellaceae bacterium]|nr:YeeE/YedE family protein [Moraxellaceae bacterium]